jgi:hypothetical protein
MLVNVLIDQGWFGPIDKADPEQILREFLEPPKKPQRGMGNIPRKN